MHTLTRLILSFLACFCVLLSFGQAIKVEVVKEGENWKMYRGGEPYFVKGVGGHVHLDLAAQSGANSCRTWGIEKAQEVLDEAESLGMTVMLGFWMGHERHGFNYNDEWAVKDQFRKFEQAVTKYKDHPALLCWGVGNEMDLAYTNFNVWDAVEDLAAMIHENDPNHPTCVVTAGIDVAEIQMIKERAPSIDIIGINTYGDIEEGLPTQIDLFGWEKPYMVTEWGPDGHWEVGKTSWGAPIEQTSSEKANVYRTRYQNFILADPQQCIGSYAFLWGSKQETTSTWYGVFLPDGSQTQAIDQLCFNWSGKPPANRAPIISQYLLDGKERKASVRLKGGVEYPILLRTMELDGDTMTYKWEIVEESRFAKSGGDAEEIPDSIEGEFVKGTAPNFTFIPPKQSGAYRLFVYIYDGYNHAATANFPFFIE